MNEETKNNKEPKPPEAKKPLNQRADAMPTNGFVLSVDGKLKTQYQTAKEAETAAIKLKQRYPVIKVEVYDAVARLYTTIDGGQAQT